MTYQEKKVRLKKLAKKHQATVKLSSQRNWVGGEAWFEWATRDIWIHWRFVQQAPWFAIKGTFFHELQHKKDFDLLGFLGYKRLPEVMREFRAGKAELASVPRRFLEDYWEIMQWNWARSASAAHQKALVRLKKSSTIRKLVKRCRS
jgi:hypothetical protein